MTTRMDGRGALTLMILCSTGDLCTAVVSTYANGILSYGALMGTQIRFWFDMVRFDSGHTCLYVCMYVTYVTSL